MIELNETKCHHFENAYSIGRCPCVSVCNDNCVFVWKQLYKDGFNRNSLENKLEDAIERISDLESDLERTEEDYNGAESRADELEGELSCMIEELPYVLSKENIEDLYKKYQTGECSSWAYDVYENWEVINANRLK